MKKILLAFFIAFAQLSMAQVASPEEFLGYKPGEKFTPYYKIVNYVKAVAAAKPDMVKVEKYGETYEGRELLLVYVSSADNMRQLENIRSNNMQVVNNGNGNISTAIVWLSYNVHGNEPSSSEAAMATLYSLVDADNATTKEWLKNTLVIIDPCMNPDGRDRYVSWFNTTVGDVANADPQSREHVEPWPGGRGNHYNFDLNRDWAWQTQLETQQRIKVYNQWMPHVHVDFHEQYYNDPYYFAPAAEPLHEVITPWQREFQTMIGKNHAGYFDKEGWLYFTKEKFDLFYPSYGDTYPIYNGAIGMTYEQAGHSAGGLAVTTNSGDTLRLIDRVMHHHTTGLSTIETASKHAARLVTEFKKYFDDSRAGKFGEYKTYILTANDKSKLLSVAELLERNGIEYGTAAGGKAKGFHFFTGKEEDVQLQQHSVIISVEQPKGALASVLLEPSSKLSDTATYDITAWSLPYAYGIDAYSLKEKRNVTAQKLSKDNITVPSAQYGYLIPYTSLSGAKTLAYLLKNGVKVRVAEKPFTYRSKNYDRGTLIVLRTSNTSNWQQVVSTAATKYNVQPEALETGFVEKGADLGSGDVRVVKAPKVAMITGQEASSLNAGEVWHFMDQSLEYPVSLINANNIGGANLSAYDVIIFTAGNYSSLKDKSFTDKLKEYVRNGGKVIAIANAVNQLAGADWGLKVKEDKLEDKPDEYASLRKYANRERDELPNSIPGAIYKVELDETHPLAFGYPNLYYTLKLDTDVYEFLKDGWNVGVIKKENYVAGFAGSKVKPKLKDGLLFGVQNLGRGSVVYFTDDPLFRMFWENGKLMFANSIFLVN